MRRVRFLTLLLLIPLAIGAAGLLVRRVVPLGPPAPDQALKLEQELSNPPAAPSPRARPLVGVVFTVSSARGVTEPLTLKPIETLRGNGAVFPVPSLPPVSGVLGAAGLYLSVQDADGAFLSVVRLADPRDVRTEDFSSGASRAHLVRVPAGTFAARVPYARGGRLSLFEVDPTGHVSRLYFRFWLDPIGPPSGGATYEMVTG